MTKTLTLTIMQGVPGSGKSTVARKIAGETDAVIVSSDDYPGLYSIDAGQVRIDNRLLGPAFGAMFKGAIEALQAGRDVIIDNTNTTVLEVAPLMLLAQAFNAVPKIVQVVCNERLAFQRNTHGVPSSVHERMSRSIKEFEPLHHWQFVPGFERITVQN